MGADRSGDELLGSPDPSSVSDLNASLEALQRMRLVPVHLNAVIQILVAAGIPMLAVVLHQIPLAQILRWIVGVML